MDSALKISRIQLLIDGLLSGNYEQGHSVLNQNNEAFCCLGIASEIARRNGLEVRKLKVGNASYDDIREDILEEEFNELSSNTYVYGGHVYFLPQDVQNWYGFETPQANFLQSPACKEYVIRDGFTCFNLAQMNDTGGSFEEIAKTITELWIEPLRKAA